ncbi:hypothetical protein IWQ47_001983 [Aquimarina sp. EL_43]|uniref:DUF1573 domain-containing protein n=1 Tax=Aquimarina TaxID=290174 RepID=UPI00046EC853|nr:MULTISPECIES: DUF1573 domain-containing protein [Aquimarina]MBG6129934.1 hypothetical protein [Aquimarina sp. EL_35]MBG6148714.1 hypothetical protein [Aquimarina sp. EL_32]MBG6168912.1 hypothetical protein [Aquimarina sp. EL_43]
MKKEFLILASLLVMAVVSCKDDATKKINVENVAVSESRDAKISDFPVMDFAETNHNFGTINEGDIVEHKFTFTNTGKAPLVIISAKGSCGCTVSKWPKEPIAPGATGDMLVTFNSNGKPNLQNKQVTITANTENGKEILKIKAMVTPRAKAVSGAPISK